MWDRVTLKQRGKIAFKRNYWRCVLVAILLALLVESGGGSSNSSSNFSQSSWNDATNLNINDFVENTQTIFAGVNRIQKTALWLAAAGILWIIVIALFIIATLFNIFVSNLIEVGGCRFFTENAVGRPGIKTILLGFSGEYYWNIVKTLFCRDVFLILWTLCFIIPGIVKRYEYRMIPYILAEYPNMSREEAFQRSKEMMDGNKLDAFILDLSFIGWHLLSIFTFGILTIFFVNPYIYAVNAELFLALKNENSDNLV